MSVQTKNVCIRGGEKRGIIIKKEWAVKDFRSSGGFSESSFGCLSCEYSRIFIGWEQDVSVNNAAQSGFSKTETKSRDSKVIQI